MLVYRHDNSMLKLPLEIEDKNKDINIAYKFAWFQKKTLKLITDQRLDSKQTILHFDILPKNNKHILKIQYESSL